MIDSLELFLTIQYTLSHQQQLRARYKQKIRWEKWPWSYWLA